MRLVALALVTMALIYTAADAHTDKTPAEVKAMMNAGSDLIVVDVREEYEFCDSTRQPPGHIAGAVNMPWNSGYLQAHYGELDPDRITIVVCRSGSRSNSAANFLDGAGFTQVFDMIGGMNAWLWETEICYAADVPDTGAPGWSSVFLGQPAPNPFRASTEIGFAVPAAQGLTRVTLGVYDCRGRLLTRLVDGERASGLHRVAWNGNDASGRPVAAGAYFVRLDLGGESRTRTMTLIR